MESSFWRDGWECGWGAEKFFQSLEKWRNIFPVIGKIGRNFPTIGVEGLEVVGGVDGVELGRHGGVLSVGWLSWRVSARHAAGGVPTAGIFRQDCRMGRIYEGMGEETWEKSAGMWAGRVGSFWAVWSVFGQPVAGGVLDRIYRMGRIAWREKNMDSNPVNLVNPVENTSGFCTIRWLDAAAQGSQ